MRISISIKPVRLLWRVALISLAVTAWAAPAPLLPFDLDTAVRYGRAVALQRDVAAVAGEGEVILFARDFPLENQWASLIRLRPPNADTSDFGATLALDDDLLAVGAPGRDGESGAVYLYRRTPEGWHPIQRLTATHPQADDRFGHALALNGRWLVVGAPRRNIVDTTASGAVYLFHCDGQCLPIAALHDPYPEAWENYGAALATNGVWLAVGADAKDNEQQADGRIAPREDRRRQAFAIAKGDAPFCGTDSGAVFLYRLAALEKGDTAPAAILVPQDAECSQGFGATVAMSESRLAVGSPTKDVGDTLMAGAVYLYRWDTGRWRRTHTLTADEAAEGGAFGASLALTDDQLAIGAEGEAGARFRSGRVYRIDLTGDTPRPVATLESSDGLPNERFGAAVALDEGRLLVGAPRRRERGIAYLWDTDAAPSERFDVATQRLILDAVAVFGDKRWYRAVLERDSTESKWRFLVRDLQPRDPPTWRGAWFFPDDGRLHLPDVEVGSEDGRTAHYTVNLRLTSDAPLQFQLDSVR